MSTLRNSVMLIGRPAADPMQNNNTISFDLVVTEKVMNKKTRELEDNTQQFRCVCKNEQLNKRIMDNVKNGKQVAIEGRLRVIDGQFAVVINDLFLLPGQD